MSTIEKAAARLVAKAKPIVPAVETPTASDEIDDKLVVDKAHQEQSPTNYVNKDALINKDALVSKDTLINESALSEPVQASVTTYQTCELDFAWLAENGFLVPGHNNPQQSQEFRRIKRPLLLNLQPRLANDLPLSTSIMFVTSALPGEGKTFVSLNLALSLAAELDKKVLLIDGDAAKGDLSRWMGIHSELGLVDLLASGRDDGESAIIDTNVERLQVMPCGKVSDNLDELFASNLMKTVLSNLTSQDSDRILVVDGPPLIATTEAAVLARSMGQVVMVVEANKTPQSAVEQAAGQLEGCQCVSMLLNKASASSSSSYGYGYGYGYGSHPEQNQSDSESAA